MIPKGTIKEMKDRNGIAAGLPYARGLILSDTEDDFRKLQRAWKIIRLRVDRNGPDSVYNFSGLERSLPLAANALQYCDDDIAPALYGDQFKAVALEHLGGIPDRHDAVLFNRMTAAIFATHLALIKPGDVVVGISPTYSHPAVVRAGKPLGARFIDTQDERQLAMALADESRVALVVLTRLAVTYDVLPLETIRAAIRLAHDKGAVVFADDAGGARVGPAVFDQPRMLELGVDIGATGLDKYGTIGPRLGLLAGDRSLVARINARAFEFGLEARPMLYPAVVRSLEQYKPDRVRTLVAATKQLARALRATLGDRLHETPVTAQLRAEDILQITLERSGLKESPIVPFEATAAIAMLLLEDYGILTVHFAGLPPGTSSLLFKFVPPETLERFGGAETFSRAVDASLHKLAELLKNPSDIRALLLGDG